MLRSIRVSVTTVLFQSVWWSDCSLIWGRFSNEVSDSNKNFQKARDLSIGRKATTHFLVHFFAVAARLREIPHLNGHTFSSSFSEEHVLPFSRF